MDNMQEKLEQDVKASLVEGYLPCAVALKLAGELNIAPKQIGNTANRLSLRITKCQLGCFMLEKATHENLDSVEIDGMLANEVKAALVNGRLPCTTAFALARKLRLAPLRVADAANKLKVKITGCQLGCFP